METTNTRQEKIKYTMCSTGSCCPVLTEIENDKFTITDDFEGTVVLTKGELNLLKNFLNTNLKD